MTPSPMKPEHEDKLCALRQPLLNVGQASRRPDNLNLLLKDSIFPQLLSEPFPPLILVTDKHGMYMPALPSSGPFAELLEVMY